MFEDGTEMDWIAKFHVPWMTGASDDGLLFGTYDDERAGTWADEPITTSRPYICEKNDWQDFQSKV